MTSGSDQPLLALADRLAGLSGGSRLAARLLVQEERLQLRLKARQFASLGRLFDAIAKFGGGSLLTAVLLLMLGGRIETGVIATALTTLIAFLGGTTLTVYFERRAARLDHAADRLEMLLKEVE